MIPQEILDEMYNCLDYADLNGFEMEVQTFLNSTDENTASQDLATFILSEYRAERADTMAKLMEIILQCNPNLALINYPENHFFRIVMITGSLDLFECYTEEVIEPFLASATEEAYKEYYTKLLHLGARLNTLFTDQYEPQLKGIHFNGSFATDDMHSNVALVNQEDYEIMCDIIDKYNTIIGRRDVIKALMEKVDM